MSTPTLFEDGRSFRPLADRLRPTGLDEFVGQPHLLAEGRPLREAILRGQLASMVFWGPPGCGKTTLARIIARHTDQQFEPFSAVTEGVPRVREIIKQAEQRLKFEGRGTILFCDEIHRFNKAQQDAFLPWVERGVITLIGATTENPSFELTGALLSRCQVYVLEPLRPEDLAVVITRGIETLSGEGGAGLTLSEGARSALIRFADGDARRALNALEALREHVSRPDGPVSQSDLEAVLSRRLPRYDKGGEEHYNLISAMHKAVRGSDVEGALYWLARMLEGGEDPLFVARRLIRMAAEDIGLADPRALTVATAAKEAFHFVGSPEGELALAEAAVYLATAPKSNRVYRAWHSAVAAAREHPAEPVPLHIRNAPTGLMRELGYGKGYRYDPGEPDGVSAGQVYLPDALAGARWYEPADRGYEKTLARRLAWWDRLRAGGEGVADGREATAEGAGPHTTGEI